MVVCKSCALHISASIAGELNFNLVGVLFQAGSIVTESFRLCLIQLLLQVSYPINILHHAAFPAMAWACPAIIQYTLLSVYAPCKIVWTTQASGIKLNPVTTLYYIAPACFVFLCIPFAFLELPNMIQSSARFALPYNWLTLSAMAAFGEWNQHGSASFCSLAFDHY